MGISASVARDPAGAQRLQERLLQLIDAGLTPPVTIADANRLTKRYSNQKLLPTAQTAAHVVNNSQASTFAAPVTDLLINYCDKDAWIAPSAEAAAAPEDGSLNGRIFIPAGTKWMPLPWSGQEVWLLNKVPGEQPQIWLTGFAP